MISCTQATRVSKTMHPDLQSANSKTARKGTHRALLVVLTIPLCSIFCVDSFSGIENLRIAKIPTRFGVFRCCRATVPENVFRRFPALFLRALSGIFRLFPALSGFFRRFRTIAFWHFQQLPAGTSNWIVRHRAGMEKVLSNRAKRARTCPQLVHSAPLQAQNSEMATRALRNGWTSTFGAGLTKCPLGDQRHSGRLRKPQM